MAERTTAEGPDTTSGKILLFGGGPRPREATGHFANWCASGGANGYEGAQCDASALVVCWASTEPALTAGPLVADLRAQGVSDVQVSLSAPLDSGAKAALLQAIENVGGIFFSGGDQNKIMRVLRDAEIRSALHRAYERGTAFGGTSAGTAVMSLKMIAGQSSQEVIDADRVKLREGLGLLPHLVLDQHFLKRRRQNRLFGVVLRHPELLGVGVDEGAALAVEGGRYASVVGEQKVMIVDARTRPGSLIVEILEPGHRFDLVERVRI